MAKKAKSKSGPITSVWKYVLALWTLFLGGIGIVILTIWLISEGAFGTLPPFEELENPDSELASEVYTHDGILLGKYYSQNRSNVTYEELAPNLVNALIATEDIRFYDHSGIDFKALIRVAVGVLTGSSRGGGSTISQQLAKNLFRTRVDDGEPDTWLEKHFGSNIGIRKLKEWVIAVRLEKNYTKEEILTMYLNTVEFSDNAFGIKSATRTYFSKEPIDLAVQESAVLIGMLRAPYTYNPRVHPDASKSRRNTVLLQMDKYGFMEPEIRDSLKEIDIELKFSRSDHVEGLAPYFRENLRLWLTSWCKNNLKPDGTQYDIYRDGLKVYTTLDSRMQTYAEESAKEHLKWIQEIFFEHWKGRDPWSDYGTELDRLIKRTPQYEYFVRKGYSDDSLEILMNTPVPITGFTWEGPDSMFMSPVDSLRYHRMFLQCGFLAVDPQNGFVKAWVGGPDYAFFKYDHVNVNTKRQIGSTFKPFVYSVAIDDKGYSPCLKIPNEKVTFEKDDPRWGLLEDWTPKNAGDEYGGMLTIKDGLAQSVNVVAAYLMHQMSPGRVIDLVRKMGITSPIEPFPSICLGTADISLIEMVGAYTTFANYGVYTSPIFISRIEDKNGNVIQDFYADKSKVLSEETSYVMVEMLQHVVNDGHGTAHRLRYKYKFEGDIGGKTGTTQNHSDGWFMGITPQLVAGCWVGCDDRFLRFRSIQYGQGAVLALPIWANFFQKVYRDPTLGIDSTAVFPKPTVPINIELDCSKFEKSDQDFNKPNTYGGEFE